MSIALDPTVEPLLEVEAITKTYPVGGGISFGGGRSLQAVAGADLYLNAGEVLAIVGESGSGKTTLGRCVLRLTRPTSGTVRFAGRDVTDVRGTALAVFRRQVQPVFQDPYASLDPRWPVGRTVRESLDAYRIGSRTDRDRRVAELLDQVGLARRLAERRPAELSGGQRQRVAIAAALAVGPSLIVADEPVSALDVSVQAQILNLFTRLRRELNVAILFIAHDLSVVEHLADRVAVMYLGRIVETGPVRETFRDPIHPYTRALLSAIPKADPTVPTTPLQISGEIASPLDPPSGCRFHPRCPLAIDRCRTEDPMTLIYPAARTAACHVAADHRSAVFPAGQPGKE